MFNPDQAQVAAIRKLMGNLGSHGMKPRVIGTYIEAARSMVEDGTADMGIFNLSPQAFIKRVEPYIREEGGHVPAQSEAGRASNMRRAAEDRFEDLDAAREGSSGER